MHTREYSIKKLTEYQAMHWCFNKILGLDFQIEDKRSIKECIQFINNNNDWLGAFYWNDFVQAHNKKVPEKNQLPLFEFTNSNTTH